MLLIKKKILILVICLVSIVIINCNSLKNNDKLNIKNIDNKILTKICGVWAKYNDNGYIFDIKDILHTPLNLPIENFSWGKSFIIVNDSIIIDKNKNNELYIQALPVLDDLINSYVSANNNIILFVNQIDKYNNKIIKYKVEINFLNNNKVKIIEDQIGDENLHFEGLYYKLGGPDLSMKYYIVPTIDNLILREKADLKSKKVSLLKEGEKLEFIEKNYNDGKSEKMNGVEGYWIKVKTESGEIGWCFGGYLEEVKN